MSRRTSSRRSHATPTFSREEYERQRAAIRSGRVDDTAEWRSPDPAPRAARRRRRRRSPLRVLGLVILVVVLAVALGALLLGMRAAAFNDKVSTAPFLSSALFGPLNGEERVNVLMVGYGGEQHQGGFLADSINIMSIDPATETTTTVPIPRDLWIEGIAQLPENGKVNEAFAIGHTNGGIPNGAQLLAEVLSGVTGLSIEHWMAIDFRGFSEMVDAVGGITIDNPTAFRYTMNEQLHAAGRWNAGSFEAGTIQLGGEEALAYARARYTSVQSESTDFARSVRQARILAGLRSKVGSGGIGSIGPGLGMMDALEDRLQTNMSAIDLFLLSGHLDSDRRVALEEDVVFHATTNTIGQYILIPVGWTGPGDYGRFQAYLADQLANPPSSPSPAPAGAP